MRGKKQGKGKGGRNKRKKQIKFSQNLMQNFFLSFPILRFLPHYRNFRFKCQKTIWRGGGAMQIKCGSTLAYIIIFLERVRKK